MQCLLLPSCFSLPRPLTSAAASTSYSQPCATSAGWTASSRLQHAGPSSRRRQPRHFEGQQQQQRRGRVVARITGKREEYILEGITDPEDVWGEEADTEFIEVDSMPIWSPEKGRVGERIFNDPDDEKETKTISIEDTAYWFAENNAGELPRTQTFKALKEVEPHTADEELRCEEVEGFPPRLKLSELEEGDELAGIVTDIWLWHGAFVDVLAEFKGLIPIRQMDWQHVGDALMPGTEVVVRVHKINEYPKYRFPLQLELLTPEEVVPHVMAPDDYHTPANVGWLYEQGLNIKEVTAALGREYEDQVANFEPDMPSWADSLQGEFGHDAAEGERGSYRQDWITQQLEQPGMLQQLQEAAVDNPPFGPGLM